MIISELDYIEVANNSDLEGASGYGGYYYYVYPSADADAYAYADALAIGYKSDAFTKTYTNAVAVSGVFSQANSGSYSSATAKY